MTTTASAILASDFSKDTTDQLRTEWDAGKMRHLIAALNGRKVVITTDKQTGFSLVGAQLVDLRRTPGYGTHQVLVVTEHNKTWTSLFTLGEAIIELDSMGVKGAKWTALDLQREEASKAMKIARERHPECQWGRMTTTAGYDYVDVKYTPSTGNDFYADKWGHEYRERIDLSELA